MYLNQISYNANITNQRRNKSLLNNKFQINRAINTPNKSVSFSAIGGASIEKFFESMKIDTSTPNEIIEKVFKHLNSSKNDSTKVMMDSIDKLSSNEAKMKELDRIQAIIQEKMDAATKNIELVKKIPEKIAEHENTRVDKPTKQQEYFKIQLAKVGNDSMTGFSKIAGYEYEKNILQCFFIENIERERKGQKTVIPNSFLFFGPTGNGKTTFAEAVAQETKCRFAPINTLPSSKEKIMADIIGKAKKAEQNFQVDNIRTILFIDEVTGIARKNSPILKDFKEFLTNCSEKYHCTVFSATNHPLELGFDPDVFGVKIGVDLPDKDGVALTLKHYLEERSSGGMDYELLSGELMKDAKNKNGYYSNSQIRCICEDAYEQKGSTLNQNDILQYLKSENPQPVDQATKEQYDKEAKILIP